MGRWKISAIIALMMLVGCASNRPTQRLRLNDFIDYDQVMLDPDRSFKEQEGTREWSDGGEITLKTKFIEIKYSLMTKKGEGNLLTKIRILDDWYDDFRHSEVHRVSGGILTPQERYSVRYKKEKDGGEVFWAEWETKYKGRPIVFYWLGFSPGDESYILQAFERNSHGILVPIRADSLKKLKQKKPFHGGP